MPETRSQRKSLVETAAFIIEIKAVHRFINEEDIDRFAQRARANPNIGPALEHLTINLASAYSQQLLQDAFKLVPNVTDLILILHPSTPRTLLEHVTFPRLALFKTDLPHGHIVRFLAAHTSLGFVDLGHCGKAKKCALASIKLSFLHDIRCPVECFTAIVHSGFTRVRGDLTYESTSMSSVLRSFAAPRFALYVLTLHFWPDDLDILTSVATFAPMIRTLRLWEKPRRTGPAPHAIRPWQNSKRWRDTLLRLEHLEHLVLRTNASFVDTPGLGQEHRVIFRWVGENVGTRKHPRLCFVAVWYRAERLGVGVLTTWSRQGVIWNGESTPSPTHMDIFP